MTQLGFKLQFKTEKSFIWALVYNRILCLD